MSKYPPSALLKLNSYQPEWQEKSAKGTVVNQVLQKLVLNQKKFTEGDRRKV